MKKLLWTMLVLLLLVACGEAQPTEPAEPLPTDSNGPIQNTPLPAYPPGEEDAVDPVDGGYPAMGDVVTAVPESYPADQPEKGTPVVGSGDLSGAYPELIEEGRMDTTPMPAPEIPPAVLSLPITQSVIADLSARLEIASEAVQVLSFEEVMWRDSSLGCPQPGMNYLQVITEGYRIVLEANGQSYTYHASTSNRFVPCDAGE